MEKKTKVYVLNISGEPMAPTERFGKVRRMVRDGQAKVVRRKPYTIQLTYETTNYFQTTTLGIDSGYNHIGISVVTEKEELFSADIQLLQGMKERNKERSSYRRNRRQRLRHRKPRFDNRKRKEGWLAPSIQHKLDSHLRLIDLVEKMIPITNKVIEVASFDTQKILNPNIQGLEYQEGVQKDFWNLREYILHRDGHKCQNPDCKNKNKNENPILEIHHIIFQSDGGTDSPRNLITLCNKCHTPKNHKGFLKNWKPKIPSLKGATFMSSVRWKLKELTGATVTYGYITKSIRIQHQIEKTHVNDAFVIAGGTTQNRVIPFEIEQKRRNNRSLEKFYDAQYIDARTGEKTSGKELFSGRNTRNKNKNSENLRVYRKEKIKIGERRIRTQRSKFQPGDLVTIEFEERNFQVIGEFNKGKSLKLKDYKKYPSTKKAKILKYGKGFCFS